MNKLQQNDGNIAKAILDRWATVVIDDEATYLNKDGVDAIAQSKKRNYDKETNGYRGTEVLWIAPKNSLVVEFESTPEKNARFIEEMESNAKAQDMEYCVTCHNGKSSYFRMFNIKNMPMGKDNKNAKLLLLELLLPAGAIEELDRTNLGWTLSPVIGHRHWKKKYNGAVHKIIRGKNPLEHNNIFPITLEKKLRGAKTRNKKYLQNNNTLGSKWVADFLLNYCCQNVLPAGSRHYIIEKNLCAFIFGRDDAEEIKERYYKAQNRKHDSLRTWQIAILNKNYDKVSPGELRNFIKEHNIDYEVPQLQSVEDKPEVQLALQEHHLDILKNPNLFARIDSEFSKFIQKEHESRRGIFLTSCLRLVKNASSTSGNLLVNGEAGSGKDYTAKHVLNIWGTFLIKRTRISPTVLTYWKPVPNWDGYILYLEDISSNVFGHEVFKVMASGGSHATVVINQVAVDIPIVGKPILVVTSATATPNPELMRRFPIIQTDDSINQTQEVIKKRLEFATSGDVFEYDKTIVESLSALQRVRVVIPFASELYDHLPHDHVIMRTNSDRFIDLIRASAGLHQHQRETDANGDVIATLDDYNLARFIINGMSLTSTSIPLNTHQKKIVAVIKKHFATTGFFIDDISPKISFIEERWLRVQINKLVEFKILHFEMEEVPNSFKKKAKYFYNEFENLKLPFLEYSDAGKISIRKEPKNPLAFFECQNRAITTTRTINTLNTIHAKQQKVHILHELHELHSTFAPHVKDVSDVSENASRREVPKSDDEKDISLTKNGGSLTKKTVHLHVSNEKNCEKVKSFFGKLHTNELHPTHINGEFGDGYCEKLLEQGVLEHARNGLVRLRI